MKTRIAFALTLLFHLYLLLHTQFTLWPEIMSSPYLILKGFVLYKDFIHPYPPILPLILTVLFKIFGFQTIIVKILVWITVLISDFILFKIAQFYKLKNLMTFGILLLYILSQTFLEGNMLWYDTALSMPILLFIYFFICKKFTPATVTILTMFFIKQNVVFYLAIYIGYLAYIKNWKVIRNGIVILFLLSTAFICYLVANGSLEDAYRWIYYFPTHYWTHFPGYVQFNLSRHDLFSIVLFSIPALFILRQKKNLVVTLFYIGAVISVYPRFSFFHFQSALAVAIVSLIILLSQYRSKVAYTILIIALICVTYIIRPYAQTSPLQNTRFFDTAELNTASKIRSIIPQGAIVYFLNLPSQYYILTNTIPPRPWIDNYGWYFEMPQIELKTLSSWQENPPQFIVWKEKINGNWYDIGAYEPSGVVTWIQSNYVQIRKIDNEIWIWKRRS